MTPAGDGPAVTCQRCGLALERCALCDETGCREALCGRCTRILLSQQLPEPHLHGG